MTNSKYIKIAVASGKGGTGKTMLATNLAALISGSTKTLLVDLDVEEPNSSLFFGGNKSPAKTLFRPVPEWNREKCLLCDICSDACRFNALIRLGNEISIFDKLCHSCFACSELCPQQALPMKEHAIGELTHITDNNLTIVEGRLFTGEEQSVPLINQTKELSETDYGDYEVKIYDSPPGTSCPVIAAVKGCDLVLLVTEPTPFGLNDLRLAYATMKKMNLPVAVVINRHGIGNGEVDEYCRNESVEIIAKIPYDMEIARICSDGGLLLEEPGYVRPLLESLHKRLIEITNCL